MQGCFRNPHRLIQGSMLYVLISCSSPEMPFGPSMIQWNVFLVASSRHPWQPVKRAFYIRLVWPFSQPQGLYTYLLLEFKHLNSKCTRAESLLTENSSQNTTQYLLWMYKLWWEMMQALRQSGIWNRQYPKSCLWDMEDHNTVSCYSCSSCVGCIPLDTWRRWLMLFHFLRRELEGHQHLQARKASPRKEICVWKEEKKILAEQRSFRAGGEPSEYISCQERVQVFTSTAYPDAGGHNFPLSRCESEFHPFYR